VEQPQQTTPRRRRGWGRVIGLAALLAVLVAAAAYGHHWWTVGRYFESTDDAYLEADSVTMAPRVAGYVAEVAVDDNEPVTPGQALIRIDDRDYRVALDQARADVAAAEADVRDLDARILMQQTMVEQAQADLDAATAELSYAQDDYDRYRDLVAKGNGTLQRAQQADSDFRAKKAAAAHDRAALTAAQQQVGVLRAQRDKAAAALDRDRATERQAELNLSYTVVAAPVAGAVGDKRVQQGQYVQPGTQLMRVVPMGSGIYLVANFKETQLADMVRGEEVEVSVDTFPDHTFKGRIDSLAPGSGSSFALLPPENATGNFTKIVQRVPVRIAVPTENALSGLLRPGLSVVVSVETRGGREARVAEGGVLGAVKRPVQLGAR
jgi:membrane fusion protein (multidrug efflux system)